ncbi:MAG: hypothetical protein NTW01_07300 [Gammaproteobacteria bacterium]|nr:hypothetical protein [Gammaproteobacteria bacterium]
MSKSNSEFVSSLAQLLRRADRLASYREGADTILEAPTMEAEGESVRRPVDIAELVAGARKSDDGAKNIARWLAGARAAIFGMALVLVAIFTFQIGLAGEDPTHRWVFFAAAAVLAVVGAVQIDRGTGQLVAR